MPRPLRVQLAGAFYHVTARGNRRQTTFAAEPDFQLYIALLGRALPRYGWRLHAYCLANDSSIATASSWGIR